MILSGILSGYGGTRISVGLAAVLKSLRFVGCELDARYWQMGRGAPPAR